ncbi:MAG TPA: hypothetical protein VN804_06355 [Solirubrobacteraceae bacterium]|nr:hypothetical protein [Solirubrobacteraceae bacterium]
MFASPGTTKWWTIAYSPFVPTLPTPIRRHSSLAVDASRWSTTRAPASARPTVPANVTALRARPVRPVPIETNPGDVAERSYSVTCREPRFRAQVASYGTITFAGSG